MESFNHWELQNVNTIRQIRQSNDDTYFCKSRNGRNYDLYDVSAKEVYTTETYYIQSKSIDFGFVNG